MTRSVSRTPSPTEIRIMSTLTHGPAEPCMIYARDRRCVMLSRCSLRSWPASGSGMCSPPPALTTSSPTSIPMGHSPARYSTCSARTRLRAHPRRSARNHLARKRPRLVPIHDDVVFRVLAPPRNKFWVTLAAALTDSALRDAIEDLRPAGDESISLLRLLDVAIWIRHSRSRNARNARRAVGVPEPGPFPPLKS
ncbi:DUF6308 family protein [Micromonospora sediminimaris]|uniref:DUF6308 family protein n=1 Tax=Micromonospora sediminimaris TaxID=547162 RepID=UPI0035A24E03